MNSHRNETSDTIRHYALALSAVLAWLLGALGLYQSELKTADGTLAALLDLLYGSLQLFALQAPTDLDKDTSVSLHVARFLAPATLAGGVVQVAFAVMRNERDRFFARFAKGHYIIAGLGDKGMSIARNLLENRKRVIALDPAPATHHAEEFRSRGGILLPIRATDYEEIEAAGIEGAKAFLAVTPSDSDNLAMAAAMWKSEQDEHRTEPLEVLVHIRDVDFRDRLERQQLLRPNVRQPNPPRLEVRLFCVVTNQARLIFMHSPLETAGYPDGPTATHRRIRLIVSATTSSTALIAMTAQTGHYLGGRKVDLHLIGPLAVSLIEQMRETRPQLDECFSSIECNQTATGWLDFARHSAKIIQDNNQDCITVVPEFETGSSNLETVLFLHERLPDSRYRILTTQGMQSLLDPANELNADLMARIQSLPTLEESCSNEAIFNSKLDRIARLAHRIWFEENTLQIEAANAVGDAETVRKLRAKPAYVPWSAGEALAGGGNAVAGGNESGLIALPERLRDSNRSQADHLPIKLRAAGFDPGTVTGDEWANWCRSNPDQFEKIAELEHQRWNGFQFFDGWQYAPIRDDSKKHSSDLVAYCRLTESTKEFDRKACLMVGAIVDELPRISSEPTASEVEQSAKRVLARMEATGTPHMGAKAA